MEASWEAFVRQYAQGNWDPRQAPVQPPGFLQKGKDGHGLTSEAYFAPPYPPDEQERRRALYRFDVLRTSPDPNFDRIVFLVKNTFPGIKIVVITLVDDEDQWFRAEYGLGSSSANRRVSFCAHAILQEKEPLIVLSCEDDWRFRHNPLVTGPPYIRFYAGAPLKTSDGYNIGSLCIIDDQPRASFSEEECNILKEFTAIAMRELELRRDRLQLLLRDRIQTSIEQFTKASLSVDIENLSDTSQHHDLTGLYQDAAELIQQTLRADGAVVIDFGGFKSKKDKSLPSTLRLYHSSHGRSSLHSEYQLQDEEVRSLELFLSRFPSGHIYEHPPSPFTQFVPEHVNNTILVPVFTHDDQIFAVICAYTEMTEMKRILEGFDLIYCRAIGVILLSAALKRRMILASRAKTAFINNITHELRTPLHGILAATDLLREQLSGVAQPAMWYLDAIKACGVALNETVDHVLVYQKLAAVRSGTIPTVTSTVNLCQLIEHACSACWMGIGLQRRAGVQSGELDAPSPNLPSHKLVELVIDIEKPFLQTEVECERAGLLRIFLNLISNALKFTSHGLVCVSLRDSGGFGEFQVVDTGKGMSQEYLSHGLFRPFSQVDPLQPGTGLGMAIVKSISDSMGGEIKVRSEPNKGSEITFTFPLRSPPDQTVLSPVPLHSARLVGFDGSEQSNKFLNSIKRYLNMWGVETDSASGADPQLVIANEISSIMASDPGLIIGHSVLLLSSSSPSASDTAKFAHMGISPHFVGKPIGPLRLLQAVTECTKKVRRELSLPPMPLPTSPVLPVSTHEANHENVVLVVEDNSILRNILSRWLRSRNYRHINAEHGLQAVELFANNPPGKIDIILMDLSMPVMDGIEATRKIREIERLRPAVQSQIIALTGMSTTEDRRRAFEAGVNEYLVKPVSLEILSGIFSKVRK